MRQVRMRMLFGLGLVSALVAMAIGAGSAWAGKDPFTVNTWGQYQFCPWQNPELTDCVYGRTSGGKEGGEFKYGHVTVKLSKPVVIQGGANGCCEEVKVFPAANGGETLESANMPVEKGLNVITSSDQQIAEWPQALKESFAAAKRNKETKAFVKIEMAGNECYEVLGCLDTENLLTEEGTVFRLPLKVTVSSPWLEKLGGGPCTIGSDENPIKQHLTSGAAGRTGELGFNEEFTQVEVKESELVDLGWHIPKVSGASGCGGESAPFIDKALNLALEVENFEGNEITHKTGVTWLTGDLHDASSSAVKEKGEKGEL